jgi:hypothetical protein
MSVRSARRLAKVPVDDHAVELGKPTASYNVLSQSTEARLSCGCLSFSNVAYWAGT